MRVRYIDTFCNDTMHEQFNASLLLMCLFLFDKVEYRAHASSSKHILKLIEGRYTNTLVKKYIFVWNGTGRWDNLIKTIISTIQNIRILLCSKRSDLLIFNYNNLFSVRLFNAINRQMKRNVVIFCHGELELILPTPDSAGLLHRLLAKKARNFFANPKSVIGKTLYFAVMGDSIKENLTRILTPEQAKQIISVNHAYIFDSTSEPKSSKSDSTLHIGTVGVFNKLKGGGSLLKLAELLNLKNRNDIDLSITGRIYYDIDQLEAAGVNIPQNRGVEPLSRAEFNSRIDKLDYILFLYPKDSYKLIASGAIMDSIARCRPIISTNNDYFSYLSNKFGKFGLLLDSVEQMADYIEEKSFEIEQYNFTQLQVILSPYMMKEELQSELKRIQFIS